MIMKPLIVLCFIFAAESIQAQSEQYSQWETEADTLYSQEEFGKAAQAYSKILEKVTEGGAAL